MLVLADKDGGLEAALLSGLAIKARDGKLGVEDLRDCLRLFCMVCNHVEEVRFELDGFTETYQLEIGGRRCAIVFDGGDCAVHSGDVGSPGVTIDLDYGTMLGLLGGRINSAAAHMNGDIRYKGTKNAAVRLQAIFELFLDELDQGA